MRAPSTRCSNGPWSSPRGPRRRGAITVLVSHRFSTVRMADTIVVMGAGTVVDAGPHPVLMERCPLYRELYDIQASTFR